MTEFNKIAIRAFLAAEFGRMTDTRQATMLDLGCGARPYLDLYKNLFGLCVAADYEPRGIVGIRLDAARLPFKSASFDVVLMTEVIEHVPEADHVLSEIQRVLKPGGLLLITWPFNYMLHEIPIDHVRFTEYGMQFRMARAGLQIETLLRRGNAILLGLVLVEFFLSGLGRLLSQVAFIGKWIEKLIQQSVASVFSLLYRLYLSIAWRKAHHKPLLVGAGLKGMMGHISLWNLGYCARARKPRALS